MPTVKCVSLTGDSLPTGRRLRPGQTADDIDITHPEVLALIEDGRLVVTNTFNVTDLKVNEIIKWVGSDPQRAATALTGERARPERDQRSSLIDKLDELVANHDTSPEEV